MPCDYITWGGISLCVTASAGIFDRMFFLIPSLTCDGVFTKRWTITSFRDILKALAREVEALRGVCRDNALDLPPVTLVSMPTTSLSREHIRMVPCRTCGAKVNLPCKNPDDKTRKSNHQTRMQDAQEWLLGAVIKNRLG